MTHSIVMEQLIANEYKPHRLYSARGYAQTVGNGRRVFSDLDLWPRTTQRMLKTL